MYDAVIHGLTMEISDDVRRLITGTRNITALMLEEQPLRARRYRKYFTA
jgi:hypothetical protein